MRDRVHRFRAADARARAQVAELELRVQTAWRRALTRAGHNAADRLLNLRAAADPGWRPPDVDELIPLATLVALFDERTKRLRQRMLRLAMEPQLVELGISFDLQNPWAIAAADEAAKRVTLEAEEQRSLVRQVVRDAHEEGLSVPDAAKRLRQHVSELAKTRSETIARTEVNGTANTGSLAAARIAVPGMRKEWIATNDSRTRPEHAEAADRYASGEGIPLNEPFIVGGAALQHPHDPSGPAELTVNCRCALGYADDPAAVTASGERQRPLSRHAAVETDRTLSLQEDTMKPRRRALRAAASGATDLPLSTQDQAWDAQAAIGRLSPDQYPDAFFWVDPSGDAADAASYQLPFADVLDGTLTAVWAGVTAAADALDAGSAGVPDADVPDVQANIEIYYEAARSDYSDDTLQPPWAAPAPADTSPPPPAGQTAARGASTGFVLAPVDPATGGRRWRMLAAIEGVPTDDGRMLMPGGGRWRDMPLTLMAMTRWPEMGGHGGAELAGRIERDFRGDLNGNEQPDGTGLWAEGVFDTGEFGSEVDRLVGEGTLTGVSIDPYPTADHFAIELEDGTIDHAPSPELLDALMWGEGVETSGMRILWCWDEYTINSATVVPDPAIEGTRIMLADQQAVTAAATLRSTLPARIGMLDRDGASYVTVGPRRFSIPSLVGAIRVAEPRSIVASGMVPTDPPAAWFDPPSDDERSALLASGSDTAWHVADDGRVFGYVMLRTDEHIGIPGVTGEDVYRADHSLFYRGQVVTREGRRFNTGPVSMQLDPSLPGHAPGYFSASAAAAHYDNACTVMADVRLGRDDRGVWAAGALDPSAPAERVRRFRAQGVSGDWRFVDGAYRLVGVLSVPVSGFPQGRVENDEALALVAAGAPQRVLRRQRATPSNGAASRERVLVASARLRGRDAVVDELAARIKR